MTRAARHKTVAPMAADPVEVPVATQDLVLRWSLSQETARAAGLVDPAEEAVPMLELRLAWDGPWRPVRAALLVNGSRQELGLEGAPGGNWVTDPETGLRHLDLPGLLRVTARESGSSVEALYARTEVLGRLGLGGGRYDFEGASLAAAGG